MLGIRNAVRALQAVGSSYMLSPKESDRHSERTGSRDPAFSKEVWTGSVMSWILYLLWTDLLSYCLSSIISFREHRYMCIRIRRFKAEPEGTHFYHSHHGTQRTDGLFGPLVVLPKPDKVRTDIPKVDKDYVMTLTEWNREHSSLELALLRTAKTERIGLDPNSSVCFLSTHGPDGTAMGTIPFHSALINGKGHYFPDRGDIPLIPVLPLETFKVKQGKFYRFRIINAGQIYPFRVSIDQHRIAVIATDGFDTEPEVAESVIIGNGERFDILVHADQPVDNYWVRVETLERTRDDVPMKPGKSFAILRYDGAPDERPDSRREECTRQRHCKIINCPFRQFSKTEYLDCTHVTDLHSTKDTMERFPTPVRTDNSYVEETFLNFHFAGYGRNPIGPVLSGRRFKLPTCPPQVTENPDTCIDDCNAKDCTDWCHCTNIKVLKVDQANQFVLVNDGNLRSGMIHSVHLHGHSFHVVKVGYPSVDPDTGIITEPTKDFKCNGVSCQYPVWSDPAWKNGDISGLNIR
ncbi:hypothetical protein FSP39_002376 [Pinctada imbricata]|uniref:Uncharacterized protein n=1 Tax=Pinctada imbricata TaxID=66713 RepID=A0AA88YWH9_PINIB|nr:hypothetical protein FSP39_002376 [Pinctada imbricata]